jgi:hypothetical protein
MMKAEYQKDPVKSSSLSVPFLLILLTNKRFLGYLKATNQPNHPPPGRSGGRKRRHKLHQSRGAGPFMNRRSAILAILSLFLVTACASVEPPKPDPVKEELTLLQKQILELQKLQNETKAKLEESTATIILLSSKIQSLEERQPVPRAVARNQIEAKPAPAQDKKKTVTKKKKTKKKTRRQE